MTKNETQKRFQVHDREIHKIHSETFRDFQRQVLHDHEVDEGLWTGQVLHEVDELLWTRT